MTPPSLWRGRIPGLTSVIPRQNSNTARCNRPNEATGVLDTAPKVSPFLVVGEHKRTVENVAESLAAIYVPSCGVQHVPNGCTKLIGITYNATRILGCGDERETRDV